jgi:hypothetical protein
MSDLLTVEDAKLLPQGKLREKQLEKIDDIFSDENIEIAAEIILAVGDTSNINFKADVLERAYQLGWLKPEQLGNINKKEEIQPASEYEGFLEGLIIKVTMSILFTLCHVWIIAIIINFKSGTTDDGSYLQFPSFHQPLEK